MGSLKPKNIKKLSHFLLESITDYFLLFFFCFYVILKSETNYKLSKYYFLIKMTNPSTIIIKAQLKKKIK